jgi:hypothetical protein
VSIEEAIEHAGAGRLADGRRYPRYGLFRGMFGIHTLMVDELFSRSHRQTGAHVLRECRMDTP